jgi:hypothetical protein
MSDTERHGGPSEAVKRRAAALRANLRRRKAQSRGRAAGGDDGAATGEVVNGRESARDDAPSGQRES